MPSKYRAFDIVPGCLAPYELGFARFYELGADIADHIRQRQLRSDGRVDILDVGVHGGVSRRFIEAHGGCENVRYHAADIYPLGTEIVYKHDDWTHHKIDLEGGLTGIESARYDVVICEQVLEHLQHYDAALADLARVLKPGGLLILGVPIFPFGLHLIRRHVVPRTDRLFRVAKQRGHVQAFSYHSLLRDVRTTCPTLDVREVRGFRIFSGGILRPLEFHQWWWRLNRKLGRLLPWACIEAQLVAIKRQTSRDVAEVPTACEPREAKQQSARQAA